MKYLIYLTPIILLTGCLVGPSSPSLEDKKTTLEEFRYDSLATSSDSMDFEIWWAYFED